MPVNAVFAYCRVLVSRLAGPWQPGGHLSARMQSQTARRQLIRPTATAEMDFARSVTKSVACSYYVVTVVLFMFYFIYSFVKNNTQ